MKQVLCLLAIITLSCGPVLGQIQYTILRSFDADPDGRLPYAGLIQASDGFFYGTCEQGGANGKGTVFRVSTNGGDYQVLHSFTDADGTAPLGRLCEGTNGFLFGTTSLGGTNAAGTLYRLGKDGSAFTVLRHFDSGSTDGSKPEGGVIQGLDGQLYGTTRFGGGNDLGAVFRISTSGSNYTNIVNFDDGPVLGKEPRAHLSQGPDGVLYGATHYGGANGFGTLFSVLPSGSNFVAMHQFANTDGRNPFSPPRLGPDGALFGTTYNGGSGDGGVVYRIAASGTNFQVLHEFSASGIADGRNPVAGLVTAADGLLYGSTYNGGDNNAGALFRMDTTGTGFVRIVSFRNASNLDGIYPNADLVLGRDLVLYGSTRQGGAEGYGTIFRVVDPAAAGSTGSGGSTAAGGSGVGGTGGGGSSTGSAGLRLLDWDIVVKRPKAGAKVPGQSRGIGSVRGRVERTGLPRKFKGVAVEFSVRVLGTNAPVLWEPATKVGKVNKRGKVKFRGKAIAKATNLSSGTTLELWTRASTNFAFATSPTNRVSVEVR